MNTFGLSFRSLLHLFTTLVVASVLSPQSLWAISSELIYVDTAVVTGTSPAVVFGWDTQTSGAVIKVYRRTLGETGSASWVLTGSCVHPISTFVDHPPVSGTTYEYKIDRPQFTVTGTTTVYTQATAFTIAALEAPLEDNRGAVLLVVDNTATTELAGELKQLEMDMVGDGWVVERLDFGRNGAATPESLKTAIQNAVTANPQISTVYFFGHLPVVYSGNLAPDGHAYRAHETDGFYADLNGTWTDTTVNNTTNAPTNVPGDGRYDQSDYPSALEVAIGRVDMAGMYSYRKHEIENLRDYIHKTHTWRHGGRSVQYRGYDSGVRGYSWIEHDWLNPIFGKLNFPSKTYSVLNTEEYLWVSEGTTDGGYSGVFTARDWRSMFNFNFLSYKQTWAMNDNAMRAVMTRPDWGLTCAWGARPAWFFHQMAAGKHIGYSVLRTQNNGFTVDYRPTGDYANLNKQVSTNFLGDPTLRMHPAVPPAAVTVSKSGATATLNWTGSPDSEVTGYHVYRSTNRLGSYTRLTTSPIAGNSYNDTSAPAGDVYYQVRAIKTIKVPTGSFVNQSQATFALLKSDGTGNGAPTAGDFSMTVKSNTPSMFNFVGSDSDGDALTPIITKNPSNGQIRWESGQPYYVSFANFTGTDTFTYKLSDGVNLSAQATVTATVNGLGGTLLAWDFPEPSVNGAQVKTSTFNAAAVQPSTIGLGSGVVEATGSISNRDAIGISGVAAASLDLNDYVSWSVTPNAGHTISLDRITFGVWQAKSPLKYELRVSTDNFATHTALPLTPGNNLPALANTGFVDTTSREGRNEGTLHSAELSGVPALQSTTAAVQFRLYFWGASASTYVVGLGKITDAIDGAITPPAIDAIEDLAICGSSTYINGTLGFAPDTASQLESGGSVTLMVSRTGGSTGPASVVYSTVDGTAVSGTDYTLTTGTLTWTDGDASSRTFSVPLLDDSLGDGNKTFTVTLSGETGADLGLSTATVTIVDDETAPSITVVRPINSDASIYLPVGTSTLIFDTTVTDDLPNPTAAWTKVSGPGTVTFSSPSSSDTGATFSASGAYVVRLTASDGVNTTTRDFSVIVGATPSSAPTNGMILHYKFDEGSGSVVTDSVNGTHTTGVSGPRWTASGMFGGGYNSTSGTSPQPVQFSPGNQADLNFDPLVDDFTISMWAKLSSSVATSYRTFYGKVISTPQNYQYFIWTPNNMSRLQFYVGNVNQALNLPSPINDDKWHLITLTNSTISGTKKFTLYYEDGTGGKASTPTTSGTYGKNTALMGFYPGFGSGGAGQMDDFRVYNRALSASEIASLYNAAPGNFGPSVSIAPVGSGTVGGTPVSLNGTVGDDGLPASPGALTTLWSKVSGPGEVTFGNSSAVDSTASFSKSGTYALRLQADDGAVTSAAEVTVSVTSQFDSWIASEGFSGANALPDGDPDGDGISNIMEYALRLDPGVADSAALPTGEKVNVGGTDYLSITYKRLSSAPDVSYTVEVGSDLTAWTTDTTTVSDTDNGDGTHTMVVRDNVPITAGTHRFIRLKVTW